MGVWSGSARRSTREGRAPDRVGWNPKGTLAIGTPAGGLRHNDAEDLTAILAAVAAWTVAIDRDRRILSKRPWRDPETGVELEIQGYEIHEEPDPGSRR